MPLAILLQEQLSVLTKGLKKVERWEAATETFSRVVARLRSAYLVRWFGTPLPTVGLALRVAFVNMEELRRRWMAIGGGRRTGTPAIGPNLTEPLLGMSGTLVGILATPLNSMLLGAALASLVDRWWVGVLGVVNWAAYGLLGTGALGLVGVVGGLGLLWGLSAWAISGQPREAFDLLGAVAELVEPLQRFWRQVTGPREAVRNPLLREILILGDRFAGLMAFVLGAFAVLVTRVGPILEPLRIGFFATVGIARELWAIISLAFFQTVGVVTGLLSGPDSIPRALSNVFSLFTRTFRYLGAALKNVWSEIADIFGFLRFLAKEELLRWWWTDGDPFVRSQTVDHPTVAYLRSLIESLKVFSAWRGRAPKPPTSKAPPSPPGTMARIGMWVLEQLGMPATTPTPPRLPQLPPLLSLDLISPLAAITHLLKVTGLVPGLAPNPLELGVEQRAVLRRAARPPSVFGAEWAALRAEAARPEPLARTLETATYLSLAQRVISPAAAAKVRELEGLLSQIDASIRAEQRRLPVRDVPEPTELSPAIRTLRVRARGLAPEALRTWVEELRRELNATPYPAPVGA